MRSDSGIPNRKKTASITELSCENEYYLDGDQPEISGPSGFFTGDSREGPRPAHGRPRHSEIYAATTALPLKPDFAGAPGRCPEMTHNEHCENHYWSVKKIPECVLRFAIRAHFMRWPVVAKEAT